MTVYYKQGVIGDLQPIARKGLGRVAELYGFHGEFIYVTSLRDGNHMAGSLHYDGLAFDIKQGRRPIEQIKDTLGPGWDVVEGPTYYHCEYDPK